MSQVAESRHPLRMVPRVGTIVPARESATGRILLPHPSPQRQAQLLGGPPDEALTALFEDCRAHGYAASGEVDAPSISVIMAADQLPYRPRARAVTVAMAPLNPAIGGPPRWWITFASTTT